MYVVLLGSRGVQERNTGVDSGRSWRFSTGAGAGLEVNIFY